MSKNIHFLRYTNGFDRMNIICTTTKTVFLLLSHQSRVACFSTEESPLINSAKIFVNPCAGLPVKECRDSNPPWGKTQQHLFRFTLCLFPVIILFGFEFVPHALTFQSAAILLPVAPFDKRLTARLTERNIGFASVVIQRIGIHRHKAGKAEISRIHHRLHHRL